MLGLGCISLDNRLLAFRTMIEVDCEAQEVCENWKNCKDLGSLNEVSGHGGLVGKEVQDHGK